MPNELAYPGPSCGGVCQRRFSADALKAKTLSDGQLSPPFQLAHPVGATAGDSVGKDVGMIGGGMLGTTVPLKVICEEEVVIVVCDDKEMVAIVEDEMVEVIGVLIAAEVEDVVDFVVLVDEEAAELI